MGAGIQRWWREPEAFASFNRHLRAALEGPVTPIYSNVEQSEWMPVPPSAWVDFEELIKKSEQQVAVDVLRDFEVSNLLDRQAVTHGLELDRRLLKRNTNRGRIEAARRNVGLALDREYARLMNTFRFGRGSAVGGTDARPSPHETHLFVVVRDGVVLSKHPTKQKAERAAKEIPGATVEDLK